MLGKRKHELEERVKLLEAQLAEEREVHEADIVMLKTLRESVDLKERTLDEMREALQQKLEQMDQRARESERELEALREGTEQDLSRYRMDEEAQVQRRIQELTDAYVGYLFQIQHAVECLSRSATQSGRTVLLEGADPKALFRNGILESLDKGEDHDSKAGDYNHA